MAQRTSLIEYSVFLVQNVEGDGVGGADVGGSGQTL